MKASFHFPFAHALLLFLGLLIPPAIHAQNVIYDMGPIPPKTHTAVTIVEQPSMALRTDGGTEPTRIYSVQVGDPPPPVVIQQKRTTSVTMIETKPKKKVGTVSVKEETHSTKPKHPAHPKKKSPVLAKASKETPKPKKHVVVEHVETLKRPAPTVVTHEKTVTTFRPHLLANDTTWVNSETIDALVTSPQGAPRWTKSHVMTISAEIPQPAYRVERETTEVRTEPSDVPVADTKREEIIDARLFPNTRAPERGFSMPAPAPVVPTAEHSDKPGFVKSPFPPYDDLDARGLAHGTLASDPVTGRQFRVP